MRVNQTRMRCGKEQLERNQLGLRYHLAGIRSGERNVCPTRNDFCALISQTGTPTTLDEITNL